MMEIARESQIIESQCMCCVLCAWPTHMHDSPHSTCLHTESMHTSILCMHACGGCVCSVCWPVCASWVMVSPALKAEQFARS